MPYGNLPPHPQGHPVRARQALRRRARGAVVSGVGAGAAPTGSSARRPAATCSPSTPRRPRSPARCTSATCSPTPTPTRSPGTSACGAARSSTRWAGTTTACPPSAGSRTTTAWSATPRSTTRRGGPSSPTAPPKDRGDFVRVSRPNFIELCEELLVTDEQAFEDAVPPPRACRWTGRSATRPSATAPGGCPSGPSCATWPAARPTPGGALAVGRHLPDRGRPGRAGGPRAARAPTTSWPSTAATAAPTS